MNDRSRMMLYALTAVACVMWIWQSVKESMNDGTIISTSNIIFLVCIGIAAIYCAANALILWWRQPGKDAAAPLGASKAAAAGGHLLDLIDGL